MANVSANIIEVEVDGQKFTKVSYSRNEEIANCITHAIPALFYVCGYIYLLTICSDWRTYLTASITCLTAICVYTISTIYHAIQDTVKKFYWRKADHSDIPYLVMGCGSAVCFLLSNHIYNYIAIGVCVLLSVISDIMCVKSVDTFKVPKMIINFVIGILIAGVFFVNFDLIPMTIRYLYLAGAILCLIGSILFAIKRKYIHSIFHIFISIGTIMFYISCVIMIQNYVAF